MSVFQKTLGLFNIILILIKTALPCWLKFLAVSLLSSSFKQYFRCKNNTHRPLKRLQSALKMKSVALAQQRIISCLQRWIKSEPLLNWYVAIRWPWNDEVHFWHFHYLQFAAPQMWGYADLPFFCDWLNNEAFRWDSFCGILRLTIFEERSGLFIYPDGMMKERIRVLICIMWLNKWKNYKIWFWLSLWKITEELSRYSQWFFLSTLLFLFFLLFS